MVGGRGVDQGGPGRRQDRRRADRRTASPRSTSTTRTSRALYPHQKATGHVGRPRRRRASTRCTGSSTPASSGSPTAASGCSPFYEREQALGAVFFEAAGWERPQWYESNAVAAARSTATASPAARPSGTRAGGRRSSTPSTWRCATAPAIDRPDRVRDLRRHRPGRARRRPARGDAPDGRRPRPRRLHAAAHPERRLQAGPDDHAPGRRHVPRRHRRRLRDVGPQVVRRPPPRRRLGAGPRPDQRLVHARSVGTRARATSSRASPSDDVSHEGLPVRHAAGRSRSTRSRCWPRGSPTSAISAGSCTCRSSRARGCGTCSIEAGGPHGLRAGRDRRVRDHRAAGEVLPRLRRRARGRVQRGRGRDGLGQGQGPGLHRQGGARRATAPRTRRRSCAR